MTKEEILELFEKEGFKVNYQLDPDEKTLVITDSLIMGVWPHGRLQDFIILFPISIGLFQHKPLVFNLMYQDDDKWVAFGYVNIENLDNIIFGFKI